MTAMVSFLAGVFAYAVFAILTSVGIRLTRKRHSPLLVIVAVGVAVHFALVVVFALASHPLDYWPYAAAYACLTLIHVFAFGAVYKSVSLQLLSELERAAGAMPLAAIDHKVTSLFAERTKILVEGNLVELANGGYRATADGRQLAARLQAAQRMFGISSSGLYAFAKFPQPEARDQMGPRDDS